MTDTVRRAGVDSVVVCLSCMVKCTRWLGFSGTSETCRQAVATVKQSAADLLRVVRSAIF